jgi:hypothetical protein
MLASATEENRLTLVQEREAAQRVAEDVDELEAIEQEARDNRALRTRVQRLKRRRVDEVDAVRLSVAASLLGLSVPTVKLWARMDLLEEREGSPAQVGLQSVLSVRSAVRHLRASGQNRNLLEGVRARLEDKQELRNQELLESLEQMRRGEVIDITPDD